MTETASTLLAALWENTEDEVVEALAVGNLTLTGNFRGHESEVVEDYRKAA